MPARSLAALGMAALTVYRVGTAQSPPSTARYTAPRLHCARFLETARSDVHTETARGVVTGTLERDGVWSFRSRDTTGGVVLEAWYDSLAVRRRTDGREIVADTDGLIGGRYRGVLSPAGRYVEQAVPFVPDEVAELADLSGAARDLLPPLPPNPLRPGETWADTILTLTRLPDTAVAGRPLLHFRLQSRSEATDAVPRGDTVPIALRQTVEEEGHIYWSPATGLVRRLRTIAVDATVPTGGRVRQPVRSRIRQQVELTRLPAERHCQ